MRLIITRPEEDASPLAKKLASLGHVGILLPLIRIIPRAAVQLPDGPWQAVCITSANAIRAATCPSHLKALPLLTVGPQSMAEARQQGFTRAAAHGGDVNGLSAYIASHLKPQDGPLLYLSGAETSADLTAKLKSKGFTVHREVVYDAEPMAPPELAAELETADGVLLYSPRTTMHWLSALQQLNLTTAAARLMHFCLSANVAAKLPKTFRIAVAESPDEAGMMSMLDRHTEPE